MNKTQQKAEAIARLSSALAIPVDAVMTLLRAERVLHRWAELECGDGNDWASWSIERDEQTDKPFLVTYPHTGQSSFSRPIADREKGALRRVAHLCAYYKLGFYHQTDPRGCALYVAREVLTDQNYTRGFAVAA